MSFEDKIKAKAEERLQKDVMLNEERKKRLTEYKNQVYDSKSERVIKLLDIVTTIRDNDAVFYRKLMDRFETEGIGHRLGFISNSAIGYKAGGFYGEIDFIFNKKEILFDENPAKYAIFGSAPGVNALSWSASQLFSFCDDFDEFEKEFIAYIKKEYGDDIFN